MGFHTIQTDLAPDALEVFESVFSTHENCFLLETFDDKYQPHTSGQSYVGISPKHVYSALGNQFYTDGHDKYSANPFSELRHKIKFNSQMPSGYCGGLVGYFGHESIEYIENSISFEYTRQFKNFMFGDYTDGVIFKPDAKPVYFYTDSNRLDLYTNSFKNPQEELRITYTSTLKDADAYAEIVKNAHEEILNGRVFQVVLANRFEYEYSGSIVSLYKELRRINPSPFMFCIKFGNIITIGASPELLTHTNSNSTIYLEALAGTIRRGSNEDEDNALAKQLLTDEKEVAEHSMLVDLARNDTGRISKVGSVKIEDLMFIKKLSHVQHIASMVSGTMEDGKDAFDALATSFSAGTLSGAPKIEAIKMISKYEGAERGPYGGTIGYFSYNGESVQAVNIRSLSGFADKLYLHSGSGIVYDSTAEREADEIRVKKAAMDKAMESFMVEEL